MLVKVFKRGRPAYRVAFQSGMPRREVVNGDGTMGDGKHLVRVCCVAGRTKRRIKQSDRAEGKNRFTTYARQC